MRFPSLLRPLDSAFLISQGNTYSLLRVHETIQGAFYAADADCAGITGKIPWALNRQWLDLLSRSGTPLFVSLDPESLGQEQKGALRAALERAAMQNTLAESLDWIDTTCPSQWRFGGERVGYDWFLFWR